MPKDRKTLAYQLVSEPTEGIARFREIDANLQGDVLLHLSRKLQQVILRALTDAEILKLLRYLDPDESTDLLQNMRGWRRDRILMNLSKDLKEKVEFLLKFDPKTAAGLMSLDYIQVSKEATFKEIAAEIRTHEARTGKFPAVLVMEQGYLIGELPGHTIALSPPSQKIKNHIHKIPSLQYDTSEEDVIHLFKKYPYHKVVVLDADRSIIGVIYSSDILKLLEKRPAHNLYDFAGVKSDEGVHDSALMKVKYRAGWLVTNLFTAFIAASVVGFFHETISRLVILAAYMPIVAGMGGNAATQTLAVVVRGLALKEVELRTGLRVIINEAMAGAMNGIITGTIVAIAASFFNENPMLGMVTGTALVVNLFIAGMFGALIPLIMKSLGKDPATSATIFITTATDVCGFFTFLGLATILL